MEEPNAASAGETRSRRSPLANPKQGSERSILQPWQIQKSVLQDCKTLKIYQGLNSKIDPAISFEQ